MRPTESASARRRAPQSPRAAPRGIVPEKIPVLPKIPLDTSTVVESTYVHHRHDEPEAQATGVQADDGGKTSARCSCRSTSRTTQSERTSRRQFSARRPCTLLTGCRAGGAPVAPFFSNGRPLNDNDHTTRKADEPPHRQQHRQHPTENLTTVLTRHPPERSPADVRLLRRVPFVFEQGGGAFQLAAFGFGERLHALVFNLLQQPVDFRLHFGFAFPLAAFFFRPPLLAPPL